MQKKSIGNLIGKNRVERKISQKDLCIGLCSTQTLSNIESNERVPDVFILEYLIERLGISADEIEMVLFDEEYHEVELRREMLRAVELGHWDLVKEKLETEFSSIDPKNTIKQQFCYVIKAMVEAEQKNDRKSITYLLSAIECTHPRFEMQERTRVCMSILELKILCMLAEKYIELGEVQKAEEVLSFLTVYTEEKELQEVVLVKIYPQIVYLKTKIEQTQKDKIENLVRCEKAFELLVDNDSTSFLAEIMEILLQKYGELHLEKKGKVLTRQLESLSSLYEEFGGCLYVSKSRIKWFKDSYRKSYLLYKELVKGERVAKNLKRKEVIEGIYEDLETLIRIEGGMQTPSHKKYTLLMERLHLPTDKYNSLQIRAGEKASEIDRQITFYYSRHEYENAKIELEKLKLILGETDSINRQYLMKQEALLALELKEITPEEFIIKTMEALKETYGGNLEEPVRIPTLEEARLFNYIGISYRRRNQAEKGVALYEKVLNCYKDSQIQHCDHYRGLILLLCNYLLLLEESNQTEKALEVIKYIMDFEIEALRGEGSDFICSELVCIYERMELDGEKKKKAIEKYIRYAFYISDLFKRITNNKVYDEYYRKNIDTNVNWYNNL